MAYLDFVEERHRVWQKRQAGQPQHWTDDPILRARKFTNVFRVLDPGSQYLLHMMQEPGIGPADALARAYLYRMTNRPETWDYLQAEMGWWPLAADMGEPLASMLAGYRDQGGQVFSGAYIIMPEPGVKGVDKARSVVKLAERYFHPDSPACIVNQFLEEPSMERRFYLLLDQPGIGPFIAMQVLTDFGYSPFGADQDEDEFVMAGPGARKGAKEIFGTSKSARDAISWCQTAVHLSKGVPLLQGRPPSKMDIQNTLCEFSKYARYMRAAPAAKPYVAAHPGPQPAPVLPGHWQKDTPLHTVQRAPK